jgi:hypothetical protein
MKKYTCILLAFVFFLATVVPAAAFDRSAHPLGVGLEVGSPSGITAKYYLSGNTAVQAGFGFFLLGGGAHLDFLYEFRNIIDTRAQTFDLPLFIGGGLKGGFGRYKCGGPRGSCVYGPMVGLRIPLGVALQLRRTPLEFQLEAAPVVYPLHGIGADMSLGVRYFF